MQTKKIPSVIKIKDYISNDQIANEAITNFSHNKYIIKQTTGMGGTSSILSIKDKSVIIVTPTRGIIKGKENKKEEHHLSIYGTSKDRWKDVEEKLDNKENFILTITFDQLVELKKNKPSLYDKVVNINWFIDEFQVFAEAEYRTAASAAYYQIFNDTKVPFILSTATPTHNFLDVPYHILRDIEIIYIEHVEPVVKKITIKPIKSYYNYVKQNNMLGNKTVVFTNDINKYKNILHQNRYGRETQTLVGDNLSLKTSLIKSKTIKEQELIEQGKIDESKNIYLLSTSYVIGYDIDFDCSMAICVNQNSDTETKYINDIIQAYGRARKNVIDATIFYSSCEAQVTRQQVIDAEKAIIATVFDENYLTNIQQHIKVINSYMTFGRNNLVRNLRERNFIVDDVYEEVEKITSPMGGLQNEIRNIINQDIEVTDKQISFMCNNIAGDDDEYNGFNEKALLIFAYGYITKKTNSIYLNDVPDKIDRCIVKLKTFLDVNDEKLINRDEMVDIKVNFVSEKQKEMAISSGALLHRELYESLHHEWEGDVSFLKCKEIVEALYCIQGVKDDSLLPQMTINVIEALDRASEVVLTSYVKGLTKDTGYDIEEAIREHNTALLNTITLNESTITKYFAHTKRDLLNRLEGLELGESEMVMVASKVESMKKSLRESKNGIYAAYMSNRYNVAKQKENHKNMILYFLSSSLAGHVSGFKKTTIDNREYNIVTKTTRQLRSITHYKMDVYDIDSEFPTFVDIMVGTSIKSEVYNNLMKGFKCSRDLAKTKYNSILNSWQAPITEIKNVLGKAGYDKYKIEILIPIIKTEKGSFFKSMTPLEKQAIEEFVNVNNIKNYTRLHDAVVFYHKPNKEYITQFGNITFSKSK
jgi:hypothetical protein